ncbi:MAG: hypothetical protein ACAH80_17240, partial [Alphaproteobacteria bacterium]
FYGRAALNGYAPAGKIMFEAFLNGEKPLRKSKEWAWYFLTVSGAAAENEELKKRSLAIAATIKPEDMEKMLENIEHWRGVQQRMHEHTEKKKRQYARP